MESGAGDRALLRKSSKSKLSKQDEVETEEPPKHANPTVLPQTRIESVEVQPGDANKQNSKLVRSHAMCGDDDTKLSTRSIDKQTSSKSGSAASSLSRDSSSELYTDSTGINLQDFIVKTLHKNPKDRTMLLQLEEELLKFANQPQQVFRFPPMSSYNRMLVHRVAAFFGMDHNVDQQGSAVVVTKTQTSRMPEVRFRDYISNDKYTEEPRKTLKRDVQSYEDQVCAGLLDPETERRKVRSFEERVDSMDRGCGRMYNQDSTSSAEVIESPISYSTSGYSSDSVHVHTGSSSLGESGPGRPWSSTDSASLDVPQVRQPLASHKAGSFGGIAYRTSVDHPHRPPNRRSQTADVGHGLQPCIPEGSIISSPQVVFAMASVDQVPPGAVILGAPQHGTPFMMGDGSWYPPPGQYSPGGASLPTPPNMQMSPCSDGGLPNQMQSMSLSYSPRSYSPSHHQMYCMMPQSVTESQSYVMHVPPYIPVSGVQYQSSNVQYMMPTTPIVYTQANDGSGTGTQVTYSSAPSTYSNQNPQPLLIMLPSGQTTPSETSSAVPTSNSEGIPAASTQPLPGSEVS